jgi:hypothetical protein
MALTKDVNSYATVGEADSYFADKLDVAAWDAADATAKAKSLVTATSLLEGMNWGGVAVSESQALSFPRSGTYFDPRLGYETELPSIVPDRILKATFELAYHLQNNDGLLDNTGSVKNLTIGSLSLQGVRAASEIPSTVSRLVQPLLANGGSRQWWRAN